jgi:hypothetical protein
MLSFITFFNKVGVLQSAFRISSSPVFELSFFEQLSQSMVSSKLIGVKFQYHNSRLIQPTDKQAASKMFAYRFFTNIINQFNLSQFHN